jgi:hypothetical protein
MSRNAFTSSVAKPLVIMFVAGALLCAQTPLVTADEEGEAWKKLEKDPNLLTYREKVRTKAFDASCQQFLLETALPQLGMAENRQTIDRVRRRMRELLADDAANPVIAEFMSKLARDDSEDMVTRVNAILLLGELDRERKPWQPAIDYIVALLGDGSVPLAVRVAAAAGLKRHLDAIVTTKDVAALDKLAAVAGPVLIKVAKEEPSAADPVAVDWLACRALQMLATLGDKAPAETTGVAVSLMGDASHSIDVRVRAAGVLGATAAEGRGIDVAGCLGVIQELAATVVREEKERVRRAVSRYAPPIAGGAGYTDASMAMPPMQGAPSASDPSFAGAGLGSPSPGVPPNYSGSMPSQQPGATGQGSPAFDGVKLALRRAVWRLKTLATAIGTKSETQGADGLTRIAGSLEKEAADLEKKLRINVGRLEKASSTTAIDRVAKDFGITDATTAPPQAKGTDAESTEVPSAAAPAPVAGDAISQ